ncbi:hypothetical protein SAY87_014519 [Trapa incisa]|uniref:Late embryogenesis abundant protein LEA-2 subgroup domain-containing protein n=2 Tax=Trapa TaxID=22665 RepID=A0AAN7RGE6_TRANT|nr:hypothetical protein SAY87_014519 [Trapa incisa]KAK4801980.1 hypothetical protein SAY86_000183 [Trapa natans]
MPHKPRPESDYHPPPPSHHRQPRPSSQTNLASCLVATVFLILIAVAALVVYFTMFRPKDPEISVSSVQLPSFSTSNSSVSFTFSQYASIRNPNRADFSHFGSSLQLFYSGNQVGFLFIPAGRIDAGRTKYMAATFDIESFPIVAPLTPVSASAAEIDPGMGPEVTGGGIGFGGMVPGGVGYRVGPTMELASRLEMKGRVRFLHFFTHHARTTTDCMITVAVTDGSVLGLRC